jgi:hypothetical protein
MPHPTKATTKKWCPFADISNVGATDDHCESVDNKEPRPLGRGS